MIFLPEKTMAVLSSSCTVIDPHGTRRFRVASQECIPATWESLGKIIITIQEMENGTALHIEPGRWGGLKEITQARWGDSSF